jgi:PleD family two-component response regulator
VFNRKAPGELFFGSHLGLKATFAMLISIDLQIQLHLNQKCMQTKISSKKGTSKAILIAEDYPLLNWGLRAIINQDRGLEICGEVTNPQEAFSYLGSNTPDLISIDLMPDKEGLLSLIRQFRKVPDQRRTAILSGSHLVNPP